MRELAAWRASLDREWARALSQKLEEQEQKLHNKDMEIERKIKRISKLASDLQEKEYHVERSQREAKKAQEDLAAFKRKLEENSFDMSMMQGTIAVQEYALARTPRAGRRPAVQLEAYMTE